MSASAARPHRGHRDLRPQRRAVRIDLLAPARDPGADRHRRRRARPRAPVLDGRAALEPARRRPADHPPGQPAARDHRRARLRARARPGGAGRLVGGAGRELPVRRLLERRARRRHEHPRPDRREAARPADPVDAPRRLLVRRARGRGRRRRSSRARASGVEPHLFTVAAAGVVGMLVAGRFLLPPGADATPEGPLFAVPSRALAAGRRVRVLRAADARAPSTTGPPSTWRASSAPSEGAAAAGLAAFSLTMGIGRLFGDRLNTALGPVRLARGGGDAGGGWASASRCSRRSRCSRCSASAAPASGSSGLFPIALRAAAAKGETAGPSVAAVSAGGYLGFLAGPPMIGGISEVASLRVGLLLLVLLCCVAALLGPAPCGCRARRVVSLRAACGSA